MSAPLPAACEIQHLATSAGRDPAAYDFFPRWSGLRALSPLPSPFAMPVATPPTPPATLVTAVTFAWWMSWIPLAIRPMGFCGEKTKAPPRISDEKTSATPTSCWEIVYVERLTLSFLTGPPLGLSRCDVLCGGGGGGVFPSAGAL